MSIRFIVFTLLLFVLLKQGRGEFIRHYMGCYRNFYGKMRNVENVSVEACIDSCKEYIHFSFAALKNGTECYCGNNFGKSTQERNCQTRCTASIEYCGGELSYSVYSICLIGRHGFYCQSACSNCKNSVPCLKHNAECFLSRCSQNSTENCDLARFLNDVNVAFNRPARHITTYTYYLIPIYPASNAVDGYYDQDIRNYRCSKTENNAKPWFYVDLEAERHIKKVNITNRLDEHSKRLLDGQVYLSNKPANEGLDYLCGNVTRLHDIEIECASSSKYRYVIVTLSVKQFLTICEIEVFANDCRNDGDCSINEECGFVNVDGKNRSRCVCIEGFSKEDIYSECSG